MKNLCDFHEQLSVSFANKLLINFLTALYMSAAKLTHFPDNPGLSSSASELKKILVAEDNDFNFFLIEAILSPLKLKIIHARNGMEAVNLFHAEEKIELILMDIQMPVMDGFTATREIKKINQNIPVIIQTAYNYDHYRKQADESGCCGFIEKPLDPAVLLSKVKQYIA